MKKGLDFEQQGEDVSVWMATCGKIVENLNLLTWPIEGHKIFD